MNDYGMSTLGKYGMQDQPVKRTRGAVVCQKDGRSYILRPMQRSQKKLKEEQKILLKLKESASCYVDYFMVNEDGELVTKDREENSYTLQRWYDGKECDTKSFGEVKQAVEVLAKLHLQLKADFQKSYEARSLTEEYERHYQELRRIRKFIRRKGSGNEFEKLFLKEYDYFADRCERAIKLLKTSSYAVLREEAERNGEVCHGDYSQHNVLFLKDKAAVVNFGHWSFDTQVADLYHFLRKIMEKKNWNYECLVELLDVYESEKPLTELEKENLKLRFLYPEKFWKLANFYFANNKVWISGKNTEKLRILTEQIEYWENFWKKYSEIT